MDAYYARQPILDENLNVHAYELLFRSNPNAADSGSLPITDGDQATAMVLEAVNWRGIERVTGGRPAYVNFTETLLLNDLALMYPSEYLTVEVLETVRESPVLLDAVKRLKEKGYTVALDDYVLRPDNVQLLQLCDVVKVEVNNTGPALENLRRVAFTLGNAPCKILAEKVETRELFEAGRALGCTLFQGYFFAKPATVLERTVAPQNLNLLRLLREVNRSELNFDAISNIIKQDVGLSYKTLQLVNSAFYGLQHRVRSIKQAVVHFGKEGLTRWLTVTSLVRLGESKTSEITVMSLIRARFCELLAQRKRRRKDMDAYFLTGLFSLLDVLTETDMATLLEGMTMPEQTRAALLGEQNSCRQALELIIALEETDWKKISQYSEESGIKEGAAFELYHSAIEWTSELYAVVGA